MTLTVDAIFKDGHIEFLDDVVGIHDGPIQVTITEKPAAGTPLQYGKYKGGHETTEEDFKLAEWHGEDEFDD